jgi:integrase
MARCRCRHGPPGCSWRDRFIGALEDYDRHGRITGDEPDLALDPSATPPRPASVAVWRSVRAHGDTKTPASRRTLGLPAFAAQALAELKQREHRASGPVFATRDGNPLDAANIRSEFTAAINAAGIDGKWSPRELRHTFVSLMSDTGVPVEEIARLAGHTSSRTTEIVYRHQLRPVMERGAQTMDQLFGRTA